MDRPARVACHFAAGAPAGGGTARSAPVTADGCAGVYGGPTWLSDRVNPEAP